MKISSIPIVKAGNDPANNDVVVSDTMNLTHDTGTMQSASSTIENQVVTNPKFFQHMPQNTLTDFLCRATEVGTTTLSSTDSGIVYSLDPWFSWSLNARIADKLASYSYIRGTVQVIAVVAAPATCYGSYVVSALPEGGRDALDPNVVAKDLYPENCMQVDHYGRIDIAAAENVVLQLPFCFPIDYCSMLVNPQPQGMWRVFLTCLSPLRTSVPSGATTGSIHWFVSLMPDYELVVPHLQGGVVCRVEYQGKTFKQAKPNAAMQQLAPHAFKKLSGASNVTQKVADVASKLSAVPIIGPYAATAAKAAAGATKVLHWFGLTRENTAIDPIVVINRSFSSLAHVDAKDTSQSASLMSNNEISRDAGMTGFASEDCLANANFFNRWTLIKQFTWSPSQGAGTVLSTLYVTPMFAKDVGGSAGQYTLSMTPAGFYGVPFQFWRGDMEYLVIIPVSKLHRGTIQIAWIPVGSVIPATITNSSLNHIYDVAAGMEKEIVVGFAREVPFLETRIVTDSLVIVPVGLTNGQLVFRVINALQVPNSASALPVDVLVFARAGANMQFAVPCDETKFANASNTALVDYQLRTQVQLQGGALGDEGSMITDRVELVESSGSYPAADLLFGEEICSIRALFQKFSLIGGFQSASTEQNLWIAFPPLGLFPGQSPTFSTAPTKNLVCGWTWQRWFGPCFLGIACSERFKIPGSQAGIVGVQHHFRPLLGDSAVPDQLNTVSPLTSSGAQNGVEFTMPWYTPVKFLLPFEKVVPEDNIMNRVISFHRSTPSGTTGVIYHAYGPDVRVVCFRQLPRVVLSHLPLTGTFVFYPT